MLDKNWYLIETYIVRDYKYLHYYSKQILDELT